MDTNTATLMEALARVEERQEHVVERIDELHLIVLRVESLEATRNRQRGAAALVASVGAVFAALKFWD